MKKIYFFRIILVLTLMLGSTTIFAQELLVHYTFDENSGDMVTDASGNANDGTIVGTVDWVDGEIDGALQFHGTESVVIPADFMGMTAAQGSVSFWVISGEISGINTLFWAGDTETGNGFGADNELHLHLEGAGADVWTGGEMSFWAKGDADDNNVHLFSDPDKDTGEGAGVPPVNPVLLNDSVWHHVAGTWGDGYLTMYIDGVVVMSKDYLSSSYPLNFMILGKMAGRDNRTLNGGSLDDVRVYDGVIDAFTVEDLFNKVGDGPGVGVDQLSANAINLSIYPNPANANANVSFVSEAGKNASIKMYNVTGALVSNVYSGITSTGKNNVSINTNDFAQGIYFVELQIGNKTAHSKLRIQ